MSHPYRAPQPGRRVASISFFPALSRPLLAFLLGLLGLVLFGLVYGERRTVSIRCARDAGGGARCEIEDDRIGAGCSSKDRWLDVRDGAVAEVVPITDTSFRIDLQQGGARTPLTSRFPGQERAQRAAADTLTRFFAAPGPPAVEVSFQDHTRPAPSPGILVVLVLYLFTGKRVTVDVHCDDDKVVLRSRLWPFRAKERVLRLSDVRSVELEDDAKGKHQRVAVVLAGGTREPLTTAYHTPNAHHARIAARLQALLLPDPEPRSAP